MLLPFLLLIFILFSLLTFREFIASRIDNRDIKECVIGPNHIAFLLDVCLFFTYLIVFSTVSDTYLCCKLLATVLNKFC